MEEKLARLYNQYNPWWEKRGIPQKYQFPYRRELFGKIVDLVRQGQNIILVGPRRVGKTVVLYQFIQFLLDEGVDSKRIFYLAGDDPSLTAEEHPVADAVRFLEKIVVGKSLRDEKEKYYLIFDEIQGIEKWAEYFKKYIDLGYPLYLLASGSSSIKMIKTTRQSLIGRAIEVTAYPFSFKEFLSLKYNFSFPQASPLDIGQPQIIKDQVESLYREGLGKIDLVKKALEDYFIYGGFPETYRMPESEVASYLKTQVIERVLFRDIPDVVEIRNPHLLQQILTFISSESANIINFTNLSSKFSARYETISTYLFYLESAFLINILRKYSRSGLTRAKTWPKVHIQDPALTCAMLNLEREIFTRPQILGRIAEGIVASLFCRLDLPYFYWRQRDKEVDIVLEKKGKVLPVEVKYAPQLDKRELSGLRSFQSKYNPECALVITQSEFKAEEEIIYLPLWVLLLMD